jgi:hypothetical protein
MHVAVGAAHAAELADSAKLNRRDMDILVGLGIALVVVHLVHMVASVHSNSVAAVGVRMKLAYLTALVLEEHSGLTVEVAQVAEDVALLSDLVRMVVEGVVVVDVELLDDPEHRNLDPQWASCI